MNESSRRRALGVQILCVLLVLLLVLERRPVGGQKDISVDALHQRMEQGDTSLVLLDVRTPEEYSSVTGHLANALLIPVQELEARSAELGPYRKKVIIAYCRTGHRSAHAAEILRADGFDVLNLIGGITQWNERTYPVIQKDRP